MDVYFIFFMFALLNFLGISLYYFGNTKEVPKGLFSQFFGGAISLGSVVSAFLFLGWLRGVLIVLLFFTVISFFSASMVEFITKKRIR